MFQKPRLNRLWSLVKKLPTSRIENVSCACFKPYQWKWERLIKTCGRSTWNILILWRQILNRCILGILWNGCRHLMASAATLDSKQLDKVTTEECVTATGYSFNDKKVSIWQLLGMACSEMTSYMLGRKWSKRMICRLNATTKAYLLTM